MGWLEQLEQQAAARLPDYVHDYFRCGAGTETTLREDLAAWARPRLRPRVLRDVSRISTATTVLGTPVDTPVLAAPTAQQVAAHPGGEAETAKGAAAVGSLVGVSTNTGVRFADIAAGGAPWWYQVYVMRDRGLTAELVRRASAAGAGALLLTVDLPVVGRREGVADPTSWADESRANRRANFHGIDLTALPADATATAPDIGPDTIGWLRELSGLPVLVKGVLRGDDARRCVAAGAAGVVVSTHGGRQLDRSVPAARALPEVAAALAEERGPDGAPAETYVDSGLRRGEDVLVALALGARAVFVGRPVLWGLATGGSGGVADVLGRLTAELAGAMALTGAPTCAEIGPDLLFDPGT
ncbi:alpha-hydroxy acid oxidase [Allostreptomyces psammosilenae]|uniref:4-hydroxymandelate oxidase n=1 Tax=Allostreptomyces psammosilenae TaxID=1892865 RepID=A0A852ZSG6_9ACTN|nr:alpha-hydroxy acid oxidase [Allostreptomyces psammosilenae]NYI04437.1 4-hydroxymandelate oxidase [Allostreptomyces psammosilenae]